MAEAFKLTIAEAASQIHRRELSPVELMVSLLGRAGSLESRLRVWVTLNGDAALAAARRSRDELTQRGPRGPLHGIPVGVKDIFYTQGIKTTAVRRSTPILSQRTMPPRWRCSRGLVPS